MMNSSATLYPALDASALPGPGDLGSTALLLDVDGTILDTANAPGGVIVEESLRSSLGELYKKCGGALALVSGRLIRDLDNLFAPLRLPAVGGHGAEMRLAGNAAVRARHAGGIGEECRELVAAEAAVDPRIVLEDKGSSLAVHYRSVPAMEQTLKARIAEIVARIATENPDQDLEIMNGKAVIEIKSTHFNKGVAVREMMQSPPFLDRRPVFIGDDITDESVFALLPALGGVGFSVERFTPGTNGTFSSPHEVRGWLASLCGGK